MSSESTAATSASEPSEPLIERRPLSALPQEPDECQHTLVFETWSTFTAWGWVCDACGTTGSDPT